MIVLKNVTKRYQDKIILENLNLTIDKGLTIINGMSGCGKTTLLKCLMGMTDFAGDIYVEGINIKDLKPKAKSHYLNKYIAYIAQDYNLLEELSVLDNLMLYLSFRKEKIEKDKITQVLEYVGLNEDILKANIKNLSGGGKQRLSIARALLADNKIILADEVTGSLDEDNAINIFELLKKVSQDRIVIVVSHNRMLSKLYADTLLEIKDKTIPMTSKTSELTNPIPINESIKTSNKLLFKLSNKIIGEKKLIFILFVMFLTINIFLTALLIDIIDFNKGNLLYNYLRQENVNYINLYEGQINTINSQYQILNYKQKELDEIFNYNVKLYDDSKYTNTLHYNEELLFSNLKGVCSLNNDDINRLNLNLEGNLPKVGEVVLTSYLADLLDKDINDKYYISYDKYLIISGIVKVNEEQELTDILILNEEDITSESIISYLLPNDKNTIVKATNYCDKHLEYYIENNYYYNLYMADEQILQYQILGGIALFFLIFITIIFLISYFYNSIYYKTKTINILNVVGSKKLDIFKMYLFNLLMAVMISIIVSLPLYCVISKCLNFTGGNISQDIPSIPLANFEFVSYIIGVSSFLAIGVLFIILFLNKLIYRKVINK